MHVHERIARDIEHERTRKGAIKSLIQVMSSRYMPPARWRVAVAVGIGALAVSALLAVTPADTDASGATKGVVKTLTRTDGGSTVELRVGDVVAVRLTENPSTGFVWSTESANGDALRLVGSEYLTPADGGVGGGGQRSLLFRAVATGTVELRLKLWREWEGDKSIVDRFAATVRVMR